jgi:type IV secretion system protein VirB10
VTGTGQTNDNHHDAPSPQRQEMAETLHLRGEQPEVARLSRKALAGGTALAIAIICGAVWWALKNKSKPSPAPEELYSIDHHDVADELAILPKDYAGIPHEVARLGPPLPGGRRKALAGKNASIFKAYKKSCGAVSN